jgi:hypothetical protein
MTQGAPLVRPCLEGWDAQRPPRKTNPEGSVDRIAAAEAGRMNRPVGVVFHNLAAFINPS